jgi:hypothetical protein
MPKEKILSRPNPIKVEMEEKKTGARALKIFLMQSCFTSQEPADR